MNWFKKDLILMCIFTIIFSSYSGIVRFPESKAAESTSSEKKTPLVIDGVAVPANGQVEIPSKRTAFSKTFLKSDATKELQVFESPVNFQETATTMSEIDSSLEVKQSENDNPGIIYKNKAGSAEINISENLLQDGASIQSGKNKISMKPSQEFDSFSEPDVTSLENYLPIQTKSSPLQKKVTKNSVSNSDLSGNINYKYSSINEGLKEEIELKKFTGQNVFYSELSLQNVYYEKKTDGYYFYDNSTKEFAFYAPSSFAYDQNMSKPGEAEIAYNYNVEAEIVEQGNKLFFKITVDRGWLTDQKRVYPVIIDPTIYPSQGGWNDDTYVQQGYATTLAWNQANLYAGYSSAKKWTHTYLPFDAPGSLGNQVIVDSANVSIYQVYNTGNHGLLGRMVTDFDPRNAYWNNQPGMSGQYIYNQNPNTGWMNIDVTYLAQCWYQFNYRVGGFRPGFIGLHDDTEGDGTSDVHYRQFYAQNYNGESNKPSLTINYHTFNASYSLSGIHDSKIMTDYNMNLSLTNTSSDFTWGTNNTYVHATVRNNSTGGSQTFDMGLPYNMGPGGNANFGINLYSWIKDSPGNYTVSFNVVTDGIGYYSDRGIPVGQASFNISDYPTYSAAYSSDTPSEITAGGTYNVNFTTTNKSRTLWSKPTYINYSLIDNETNQIVNSVDTALAREVGQIWTGDSIVTQIPVKVPQKIGTYTLKWDMRIGSGTLFSANGVTTLNYQINVTAPSFASIAHLGTESYYPTAGPVDLTTGGITYSVNDASMPSITGSLDVGRTYNSNTYDQTYPVYSGDGSIQNWLVNGPYYENDEAKRFDTSYIDEANIKPSEGMITNNRVWYGASTSTNSGTLDLVNTYKTSGNITNVNNLVTYLSTYVYSASEQDTFLSTRAGFSEKVWINGKLVVSNNPTNYSMPPIPRYIHLDAGWTSVVVKVTKGIEADCGFSARFEDGRGPQLGLKVSLNNPDIFRDSGVMGPNWTPNFYSRLEGSDGENVYYRDQTGGVNIYPKKTDGTYTNPAGSNLDLVKNSDGTYSMSDKFGTKINFRSDGKMVNRTDTFGNKMLYTYDDSGHCVKIQDSTGTTLGGRYYSLSYTNNLLTSIQNQTGQTIVSYEYNANNRLTRVVDSLGNAVSYIYDDAGRMTKNTDKIGATISLAYNAGKIASLTDSLGNATTFVYSASGSDGVVEIADPNGSKFSITYDLKTKLMSKTTDANGYSAHYEYDSNYNVAKTTPLIPENDDLYYSYYYKYDSSNNLISATDPLSNETKYEYQNNYPTKTTDPKGNSSTNIYNASWQLISSTDALTNTTKYTYDVNGRVATFTDASGAKTSYGYNSDGDTVTVISPTGQLTKYGYDSVGHNISQTSPLLNGATLTYDVLGRLITIADRAGLTNKVEYDANNRIVKQINPRGFSKEYQYNSIGKLLAVKDEIGATVSYEYDKLGNQTKVTDAKGKFVTYEYDKLSQLVKVTDARGKSSAIVYNKNGNVTSSTDIDGNQYSQSVNKAGQVVAINSPDGSANVSYDKNGNVTNLAKGSSSLGLSYDANNNTSSITSTAFGNVSALYNKVGDITSLTTPNSTVDMAYDAEGNVSNVSQTLIDSGITLSNNFVLDGDGRLTKINKANGENVTLTYDASSRIDTFANVTKKSTINSMYLYTYDANSNITKVTDRGKNAKTYAYDARDQLTNDNGATFTYDISGNRTTMVGSSEGTSYTDDNPDGNFSILTYKQTAMVGPSESTSYTYDNLDGNLLLSSNSSISGNTAYEYDNMGNVTKKTDGQGKVTQYTYDTDNYFTKAILPDGTIVEYSYDKTTKLRTKRVETSPSGIVSTINFIWDADRLVSETDENNNPICSFTWGDDEKLISVSIPNADGVLNTFYYQKNAKGDILGMTDQNGTMVVSYDYDAWGNVTKSLTLAASTIPNLDKLNPRLYSSYWYDSTLGNYFMKIRLYDPTIGRFLSKDPIQTGIAAINYNPYAYCANNPIVNIDPSGKGFFNSVKNFVNDHRQTIATVVEITVAIAVAVAITAASGGLAAGFGALIIAGAVGGAIGAAAGYTVSNWGHLTWQGYAKSTAIGAVSGAVGAAIGYGVGKAVVGALSFIVGKGVANAGMAGASTVAREVAEAPLTSTIKPIFMTMEEAADSGGVTKSSLRVGQQMHNSYMADVADDVSIIKEYRLPSGKRIDCVDLPNRIIYELKPNNPRSISGGLKQLNGYQAEANSVMGPGWTIQLNLY